MPKLKTLTALVLFFLLSSCVRMVLNKYKVLDTDAQIKTTAFKGKEIVFVEMKHLAKQEFYDNSKKVIQAYRDKGFTVWAEGNKEMQESGYKVDTVIGKKIRKLMGFDLSLRYAAIENNSFKRITEKYGLVNQPLYKDLGAGQYQLISMPPREMIAVFEKEYGTIPLDSCDINTKLGTPKYACQKMDKAKRKIFMKNIVIDYQNINIAERIRNATQDKILIIYGSAHTKGIIKLLENEK